MTTLFPVFAFLIGMLGVTAVAFLLRPAKAVVIDRRLRELTGSPQRSDETHVSAWPVVQF